VEESIYLSANISDFELQQNKLVYRDLNIDDGSLLDKDEFIDPSLIVKWDINLEFDDDKNANPADDYLLPSNEENYRVSTSWDVPGTYQIGLQACDSLGMCDYSIQEVNVVAKPDDAPSLSDFEFEDWKSWTKEAGSDLATFVSLITVALILGWLVMRESSEVEDEAKQAAESYSDVEHVEVQGGLLGMDQHNPPPAPGILSKEERRSDDSGYIRPLKRRL
jgi:hypothetical protein